MILKEEWRTYVLQSMIFKGNRGHMSSNLRFSRGVEDVCPEISIPEGESRTYGSRTYVLKSMFFRGESRTYVLKSMILKGNRGPMSSNL